MSTTCYVLEPSLEIDNQYLARGRQLYALYDWSGRSKGIEKYNYKLWPNIWRDIPSWVAPFVARRVNVLPPNFPSPVTFELIGIARTASNGGGVSKYNPTCTGLKTLRDDQISFTNWPDQSQILPSRGETTGPNLSRAGYNMICWTNQ